MKHLHRHVLCVLFLLGVLSAGMIISGCAQTRPTREEPPIVEQPEPLPGEEKVVPQPREPEINVELWFDKYCGASYKQGEKIVISFRTSAAGYVTIYDIDTSGNVSVLFPNKEHPDNFVERNREYTFPDPSYSYDLIVEGPEGIEYVDIVASTDPAYHWNYHGEEPRWLYDWGLKGRRERDIRSARSANTDYTQSPEYQQRPQQFTETETQRIQENFLKSRQIREQIRSKIVVQPRDSDQPPASEQYDTASCYFYVLSSQAFPAPQPTPSADIYLRQQQRDFEQIPGLDVSRSGERLIVAIPSTILFDYDSYELLYGARQKLDQVADVLVQYPETALTVAGHTDNIGSDSYNQRLSESRAQAVSDHLMRRGVQSYRITVVGYGESQPVASNDTEAGRQRNRRVELEIRMRP